MVKKFFAEIFLIFGIILLLLNLMMKFNYGNFTSSEYFGITTLFEMLNPENAQNANLVTNINSYMEWVNGAIPKFTSAVETFRQVLGARDNAMINALFGTTGAFQGLYNVIMLLTYVVQFVAVIALYAILILMYLVYLLEVFVQLISGNWYSIKPTAYWTYPQVVHGLTMVYTI